MHVSRFALLLACLLFAGTLAHGATLSVSHGPAAGQYASIAAALGHAAAGDTIEVIDNSAPFVENVYINGLTSLTLQGRAGLDPPPTIQGINAPHPLDPGGFARGALLVYQASGVRVRNLLLDGGANTAVLDARFGAGARFEQVQFLGTTARGTAGWTVFTGANVTFDGCDFAGGTETLVVNGPGTTTVNGGSITGGERAIVQGSGGLLASGCQIRGSAGGGHLININADQPCVTNLNACLLLSLSSSAATHSLVHLLSFGAPGNFATLTLDNCDLIGAANGSTNCGLELNRPLASVSIVDSIFYRLAGPAIANTAASTLAEDYNAFREVTYAPASQGFTGGTHSLTLAGSDQTLYNDPDHDDWQLQPSSRACRLNSTGTPPYAGSQGAIVYPDDAYSRPRQDHMTNLETLRKVAFSRVSLPQQYLDYQTLSVENAQRNARTWARWRFNRKTSSTATTWLNVNEYIRRPFEKVTFRAYNASSRWISLAACVNEHLWHPGPENHMRTWLLIGNGQLAPGEERLLTFTMSNAVILSGKSEPPFPIYPMAGLSIATDGNSIVNDNDYDLWFSDLTLYYPAPSKPSGFAVQAPAQITAEQTAAFNVSIAGAIGTSDLDLELRREPYVQWRIRLTAAERAQLAQAGSCRVERVVPWYLSPGGATVGLVSGGYRVTGSDAALTVINTRQRGFPTVERRQFKGRPTPFVNGEQFAWNGYANNDYQPGNVNEFGASGANVFYVYATADDINAARIAGNTGAVCQYDIEPIAERVAMALAANPATKVVIRVPMGLPRFWALEHMNDGTLATVRTAQGDLVWDDNGYFGASMAAAAWRTDQAAALRQLIDACKAQPWAERVIAIWLSNEYTEEWFAWGDTSYYGDYSTSNAGAFTTWLQAQGLPTRAIPSPAARDRAGYDVFPADTDGKAAAAYSQFYSDLTAETIKLMSHVVKEESAGKLLTGVFYAYLMQSSGSPRQSLAGHNALRAVLDSPDVDFTGGVPLHDYRQLTNGYSLYISATESILAAGKFYVNENDLFSWRHPLVWYTEYDPADPRGGAISMHRRELANNSVHGALAQWFALACNWHHDAGLQADFAKQIKLYAQLNQQDRTGAEEIAFVIDDTSFNWAPPSSTFNWASHRQLLYAMGQSGMPVGVWLLSDLGRLPARIKLVIVANATAALPADIAQLSQLISAGGRTIMVVGAPGLVDPTTQTWNVQGPSTLLGLPVVVEDAARTGVARLVSNNNLVSTLQTVRPRAYAASGNLMVYDDQRAAACERTLANGGRLVWCGVPPLDTTTLRALAVQAGVQPYAPAGFTVHAAKQVVALTSSAGGTATVQLPSGLLQAHEVFQNQTFFSPSFSCTFAPGETKLFELRFPVQSVAANWSYYE